MSPHHEPSAKIFLDSRLAHTIFHNTTFAMQCLEAELLTVLVPPAITQSKASCSPILYVDFIDPRFSV
jgi:hypothetical protein